MLAQERALMFERAWHGLRATVDRMSRVRSLQHAVAAAVAAAGTVRGVAPVVQAHSVVVVVVLTAVGPRTHLGLD